ncbi:hypothetical protein F511_39077 [Dorcoceras hygrometricum]|uniref:Uncharacterized protein n=1 Tax=Dorcoceras hygrometricum TaxID=472368 RepID=A0A2Z7BWT3_9LAMI|nr:hypothetical protein F511_39077 [Dorcoceras hygrometricum]
MSDTIRHSCIDQIRTLALIPLLGNHGGSGSRLPARQRKNKYLAGRRSIPLNKQQAMTFIGCITDSACKNQLVVVSIQYGPFNPYIPIRSTTIGKSRVAKDPIAMHTSWRSNSDITSVTSIGYPRMSGSGESSTTMHRLLHASGSHPIPPPNDPKYKQTELEVSKGCRRADEKSSSQIKPSTY